MQVQYLARYSCSKIKISKISLEFILPVICILLMCITDHKIGKNMTFHLIYDLPLSFV